MSRTLPKDQPKRFRPPLPYMDAFRAADPHDYLTAAVALRMHAADEADELREHPLDSHCARQCEALDLACVYGLATEQLRQKPELLHPTAVPWRAAYRELVSARRVAYDALLTLRPAIQLRAASSGPCYARWSASQGRRGRHIPLEVRSAMEEALEAAFIAVVSAPPDTAADPALPSL